MKEREFLSNDGWDYSELTKTAKKFGGPEEFCKELRHSGYKEGIATWVIIPSVILGIRLGKYMYKNKIKEKLYGTNEYSRKEKDIFEDDEF